LTPNKIEITCTGSHYIEYKKLVEFQGDLKTLSSENLEKLRQSILRNGFTTPFFVWESPEGTPFILDGHQRLKALKSLIKDNYTIDKVPIVKVQAESKDKAKEKLLAITSQYGEFHMDTLNDWMKALDEDTQGYLRLVDTELQSIINQIDSDTPPPEEDEFPEKKRKPIECPDCGAVF